MENELITKTRELNTGNNVKVIMQNTFFNAKLKRAGSQEVKSDMHSATQKLIRLCIAQCKMTDKSFYEYSISANEIIQLFGVEQKEVYKKCSIWAEQALATQVGYRNDKEEEFEYTNLFSKCKYKSGVLTMKLSEDMTPYFLNIKKELGYTQYELSTILSTKGKHTIPIYELISKELKSSMPYADKSRIIYISQSDIRNRTGTENMYKNSSDFKKRVLIPSIKEIETIMNIKIEIKEKKASRNVVGYELTLQSAISVDNLSPSRREYLLNKFHI